MGKTEVLPHVRIRFPFHDIQVTRVRKTSISSGGYLVNSRGLGGLDRRKVGVGEYSSPECGVEKEFL